MKTIHVRIRNDVKPTKIVTYNPKLQTLVKILKEL